MSLKQELLQFVRTELSAGADTSAIDEDTQLIDDGIIDSMALMRLIGFIEERSGMRIPDEEVLPDNFQTINRIQSLVDRMRAKR